MTGNDPVEQRQRQGTIADRRDERQRVGTIADRQTYPWRPEPDPAGTHPDVPKEVVLLPLRLFLAVGWLRAGVEKAIEPTWWDGEAFRNFAAKQHDDALIGWRWFLDHPLTYQAPAVSVIVLLGELAIGLAILANFGMTLALRCGIVLNVLFVASGVTNPSAFYLVLEMVLLSAVTDRAVGMKPAHPQRRILIQAAAWFAAAALFLPFVRTVEPSEVIGDPASILSLIAAILGATLVYRWWLIHQQSEATP